MDRAIQKTDDDALQSKAAASLKGYFNDPLLKIFCSRTPPARLPLINIGTYCRVFAINQLIDSFLNKTKGTQRNIVSLGAGSDTRPFHLLPKNSDLNYYELDFKVKIDKKRQLIKSNSLEMKNHHLIDIDLRKIDELKLDIEGPTLLLSECCLCYMNPTQSDNVISYFSKLSPQLTCILYEPLSLNDEFGRVMAENLAMRGLSLPTIDLYSTLEAQVNRLKKLVGGAPKAVDIDEVRTKWVPTEEYQRIQKLEFLDEMEEMQLLLRHYCVAFTERTS